MDAVSVLNFGEDIFARTGVHDTVHGLDTDDLGQYSTYDNSPCTIPLSMLQCRSLVSISIPRRCGAHLRSARFLDFSSKKRPEKNTQDFAEQREAVLPSLGARHPAQNRSGTSLDALS